MIIFNYWQSSSWYDNDYDDDDDIDDEMYAILFSCKNEILLQAKKTQHNNT